LAENVARLTDLFVNDAFGNALCAHSSAEDVIKFLKPCVSGFLLKREMDYLKGAVNEPKRLIAVNCGQRQG